ncbi:histone deacetylase complex protein [Auriscalpium vulgare]|uniref:Histone deacetylase complex protein n=1 Tax=Auriscalpium vulgare TaxID=40419 RepID=A0ACB8R837_9AGAM|nr:histone deacetylase complex protein [Auriscalpium vulgare]
MESSLGNGDEAMDVDPPAVPARASVSLSRRSGSELEQRATSLPLQHTAFTVGYVYSSEMMLHSSEEDHPEQPERVERVYHILQENGCLASMKRIPIRPAKRQEVLLVHSLAQWQSVINLRDLTRQDIVNSAAYYDGLSLYVHPSTPRASLLSCGGVIEASLAVARRELKKTFAIVRPPGHHAEPEKSMGFCFFNNVAVAVKIVQQLTPIRKVLILDWDVHHGNGTQRAFNDDPSVLYISLHRYEQGLFYPCGPFGSMESCGEGKGIGFSVNIPWPEPGMRDADYIHAFQQIVMPIATEFAPELVIISAGFDAADGDQLGECHVTPAGYAHMTHMLAGLAGGRVVVALEGGYNLDALSSSALSVGRTLLGEAPPEMSNLVASEIAAETVYLVAKEQSRYWKSINVKACEPRDEIESITFTIPELLKAHRQEYMYREFNMLEVPVMLYPDMEDMFSSQVMCSDDFYGEKPLVIFAHEFGNIRVEIADNINCDLHLEHSYLVDASKQIIQWVKQEGYALLDINVFPKPPRLAPDPTKTSEDYAGELIVYLWDNYVTLSPYPRKVVLVGHGPGVQAINRLLHERMLGVMNRASVIVQVVGFARIPMVPKGDPELTVWYREHSLVIVPTGHSTVRDSKQLKRHGRITPIDEEKPVKLLMRAMPIIKTHVKSMIGGAQNGRTRVPPAN